jgi:hypothetical protein
VTDLRPAPPPATRLEEPDRDRPDHLSQRLAARLRAVRGPCGRVVGFGSGGPGSELAAGNVTALCACSTRCWRSDSSSR